MGKSLKRGISKLHKGLSFQSLKYFPSIFQTCSNKLMADSNICLYCKINHKTKPKTREVLVKYTKTTEQNYKA